MKLAVLFGSFAAALGCSSFPTWRSVPVDCTVESQYELDTANTFTFEMVGTSVGWTAVDNSPGSMMNGEVKAMPDGDRCGSTAALVLTADKNSDWGSLFGLNNFGPKNEEAYEGMSFWARSTNNTNTAFTLVLDDPNTTNPTMPPLCDLDGGVPPRPDGGFDTCRNYCNDGGVGTGTTDGTGMIIPGTVNAAPEPDQCGNAYQAVVAVASFWKFYTIPFDAFVQLSAPNRVPNKALPVAGPLEKTGLRTSQLSNLIFRLPKAVRTELWIDNLGFYRRKAM